METGHIHTTIDKGIATLSFFHPASNSLPSVLLTQMTAEFKRLDTLAEVRVVVLKSEGNRAFCAGASFDELLAVTTPEEGDLFFMGFANLINAMRLCSKVIVGAIQGKAVGGGVGLLSACDYCIATEAASVKLSELFIGIGAFVIEPAVTRKIGKAAFCHLTLEASEWHDASWALSHGLYAKTVKDQDALVEAVASMASQLASYHPNALLEMKKVFWEGTEAWDTLLPKRAAISGALVLSDFTKEILSKWKK
jgi:methylglutaconyl-CoA hydratase